MEIYEECEVRRWEDLVFDCLVLIFQKVGLFSLLCDIPFVCSSWYKASLDPACWRRIDLHEFCEDNFSKVDRFRRRCKVDEQKFHAGMLVDLITARGKDKCTSLAIPVAIRESRCRTYDISQVPRKWYFWDDHLILCEMARKLKLLNELSLTLPRNLRGIIYAIGDGCKNLHSLTLIGAVINKFDAFAISNHIRKLKKLNLQYCDIKQEHLEILVSCCKNLEYLNVFKCRFLGIWEENKLKDLASHLKVLNIDASRCDIEEKNWWKLHENRDLARFKMIMNPIKIPCNLLWVSDTDCSSYSFETILEDVLYNHNNIEICVS